MKHPLIDASHEYDEVVCWIQHNTPDTTIQTRPHPSNFYSVANHEPSSTALFLTQTARSQPYLSTISFKTEGKCLQGCETPFKDEHPKMREAERKE